MANMADTSPREPGERRRLDRPPGERYRSTADATEPAVASAGVAPGRGLVLAALVGIAGAVLDVVLAGLLAVSSGLLVVALIVGRFVALAFRFGAGSTVSPRTTVLAAVLIALGSVFLAQLGIWLYARSEGGVLELTDYLGETFGVLVPLQFAIAGIVAWLSSA
jgi:hypothetical protein